MSQSRRRPRRPGPAGASRARASPTSATPASRRSARRRAGTRPRPRRRPAASPPSCIPRGGRPWRHTRSPRHLEVGVGVHVDVAVSRRRVHHRHGRDVLQRLLQTLAAARDQQVDEAVLGGQLGQLLAPPASSTTASSRQPHLGQRLADDRRQRPVGALGVAGAAQHDRVAALDRQRRAVDRHVGARLVDDGDNAERHPDLAQLEAARQRLRFELLADRIGSAAIARTPRPSPRPARRSGSAGRAAPPSDLRRARRRGRQHSPRGSRPARSPSSRAVASTRRS